MVSDNKHLGVLKHEMIETVKVTYNDKGNNKKVESIIDAMKQNKL